MTQTIKCDSPPLTVLMASTNNSELDISFLFHVKILRTNPYTAPCANPILQLCNNVKFIETMNKDEIFKKTQYFWN